MKKTNNLLLFVFVFTINFCHSQNVAIKEEKYKNLKNEVKLLSELINDSSRSIANFAPDRPYEYFIDGSAFIKEYKNVVKGSFNITTEIYKTKDVNGREIFELATIIYFTADMEYSEELTPILLNIKRASTSSLYQSNLYREFDVLTNYSKNLICALTNRTKEDCVFDEYWGD